ncbi:MAG: hypothetical protein IK012_07155 [Fibrobacter sp.]|uniref:glucuronyl esterase domain-containing protein n=1 Tax=Fibrobacter sp. TaxID=35828 RepID=UPI0025BF5C39|nr:hypothetical protein [Fibrobacter sp.]MBR4785016.1 hypothetical protein [Fibrobacter sp.]
MKQFLYAALAFGLCSVVYAQAPLNFDVENRGKDLGATAGELKSNKKLPNPFEFHDGSKVTKYDDWSKRRNEIKADIEKYEIGEKPIPSDVSATYSGGTLTVTVKEGGQTMTITSKFSIPSGNGPHPIIIGMNSGTGSLSSSIFSGFVQVPFSHDQVAKYSMNGQKDTNVGFYKFYSDKKQNGDYSAWSWGVSRLIDGLALIADEYHLDMSKIAVTGCSYAGKMALFAGAFDERVTLTIAQESGGGGINSWRTSADFASRGTNIEKIDNTNYSWFMQSLKNQDPYKLPHDHHELIAMIAPRAVIALGNPGYEWLGDESGYKSMMAATEVWKAMGIEDRIGFDFTGGHEHCQAASSQTKSVTAFVDKFLRNKDANTDIHVKPTNGKGFKIDNYGDWIDWETPDLPFTASSIDTIPQDTVPKDTGSTGDTSLVCHDGFAAPALSMHVTAGRIEVNGAPAGARVKLFDVRGNVVAVMGANGGFLPKVKGRLLAIVENDSGKRLMSKAIINTGF